MALVSHYESFADKSTLCTWQLLPCLSLSIQWNPPLSVINQAMNILKWNSLRPNSTFGYIYVNVHNFHVDHVWKFYDRADAFLGTNDVDHLEQDNIFLSVKLVTTNLLIIGSKCRPKRDRTAIRLVETNPYRCTSQRSLRGWGAMVASLIRDTMKG